MQRPVFMDAAKPIQINISQIGEVCTSGSAQLRDRLLPMATASFSATLGAAPPLPGSAGRPPGAEKVNFFKPSRLTPPPASGRASTDTTPLGSHSCWYQSQIDNVTACDITTLISTENEKTLI